MLHLVLASNQSANPNTHNKPSMLQPMRLKQGNPCREFSTATENWTKKNRYAKIRTFRDCSVITDTLTRVRSRRNFVSSFFAYVEIVLRIFFYHFNLRRILANKSRPGIQDRKLITKLWRFVRQSVKWSLLSVPSILTAPFYFRPIFTINFSCATISYMVPVEASKDRVCFIGARRDIFLSVIVPGKMKHALANGHFVPT